jgi:hypothetical protein
LSKGTGISRLVNRVNRAEAEASQERSALRDPQGRHRSGGFAGANRWSNAQSRGRGCFIWGTSSGVLRASMRVRLDARHSPGLLLAACCVSTHVERARFLPNPLERSWQVEKSQPLAERDRKNVARVRGSSTRSGEKQGNSPKVRSTSEQFPGATQRWDGMPHRAQPLAQYATSPWERTCPPGASSHAKREADAGHPPTSIGMPRGEDLAGGLDSDLLPAFPLAGRRSPGSPASDLADKASSPDPASRGSLHQPGGSHLPHRSFPAGCFHS